MRKEKSQKNEVIYILISKDRKYFLIARGAEETLRETYRHHVKLRRKNSEQFFGIVLPERPCLCILERIDPEEKANLLLVWLRILRDRGYISVNSPDLIEMSKQLFIDNDMAYRQRKDTDLSKLMACEGCLIPRYNKITCDCYPGTETDKDVGTSISKVERKRNKVIHLRLSESEYECIRKHAQALNMQVNPYIRMVAENPVIRHYNYKAISDHTEEIGKIRQSINRLLYTIDATNNYLPQEIGSIVNMMHHIFESENKLLKTINKQQEKDTVEND